MEQEECQLLLGEVRVHKSLEATDKLLAEFDRLTAENDTLFETLQSRECVIRGLLQQRDALQSWLDKISEPLKHFRKEKISQALCNMQVGPEYIYGYIGDCIEKVVDYLDSQKPSEKPILVHSDDSVFWVDCPICNPKPSEELTVHLCKDGIWEYFLRKYCVICNPPYIHEMDSNLVVICQPALVTKYFKEKP